MSRNRTIIDCYTDEPAGLGVPPFLGVWPRYIAGKYRDVPNYLTIDDLRIASHAKIIRTEYLYPRTGKTKIHLINYTRKQEEIQKIIRQSDQLIFVAVVQTPGKYLSAVPGTINEIARLAKQYRKVKMLTGPAALCGSQLRGGAEAEIPQHSDFSEIVPFTFSSYEDLRDIALKGISIVKQIPGRRIVEIETGRGCIRTRGCSFCTEPIKSKLEWRTVKDIVTEIKEFIKIGMRAFRLGRQSCIFSYANGEIKEIENLLKGISKLKPDVLHIDNANPAMITKERTRIFANYLTPGSTAAIGAESFDDKVIKQNNLNSNFAEIFEAIKIVNSLGGQRGDNGCHLLLPGINLLLGLKGEDRNTLEENFKCLKIILDSGLLIRRINIRQVVPFPGTQLYNDTGRKYIRKNRKYYASWIKKVRKEIDLPMLKRLFPRGLILKDMISEIYEGNVTFLRQLGSYPIVVGVRERLPHGHTFNIEVIDHMFRSIVGRIV